MKYWGFNPNDFQNGDGISVSLWVSGCPHRCSGCFNQEAWDYDSGYDIPDNIIDRIKNAICANGVTRNFSVLGGEPLCEENIGFVDRIINEVRNSYKDICIYIWTGYELCELKQKYINDERMNRIFSNVDYIVDGKYDKDKHSSTLPLRGSTNQKIRVKGLHF